MRKLSELEGQLVKLREELGHTESQLNDRGMRVIELEEQLKNINSHSERIKELERENSEIKAA